MQVKGFRAALLGAATVGALLLSGTAQAALQDRDLDGNGQVDAFYDTDLDITWLRDANVNGLMEWDAAMTWVGGYTFAGLGGWRLPSTDESCPGDFDCTGSEMGHLWYVELGNLAGGPMTNTGGFLSLQFDSSDSNYWSGTEAASNPDQAWFFVMARGLQATSGKGSSLMYAMAVRDGDVPSIPEPETYALMLAGLAGLAIARRLQRR